ncbi:MAG: hydroxyacid dehydrogenase [Opitutales bacterium]|nr:hydroxyacid dehydrogenase [Opitutales bacterium]
MTYTPDAVFCLGNSALETIYGPIERAALASLLGGQIRVIPPRELAAHMDDLKNVRFLLGGWGSPVPDAAFFELFPKLELYLYGAGATDHIENEALRESGVRLTSAIAMNAIPVAEFTFAVMILGLKNVVHFVNQRFRNRAFDFGYTDSLAGTYRSRVGLVSLGHIGRLVAERLRTTDVEITAYDPFMSSETAARLGVRLVSLETLFTESDVVSLHTPLNAKTMGMITRDLLDRMKQGSTFINTARARLIQKGHLEAFLTDRPDVQAFVDVTNPEPPPADSPLWTLGNVVLTPHIAGSKGPECNRMGQAMVEELRRYLAGESLNHEIHLRSSPR